MYKGKFRFYAVRKGWHPDIYSWWPAARKQVDGFKNNEYKGFMDRAEAEAWLAGTHLDFHLENSNLPHDGAGIDDLVGHFQSLKIGDVNIVTDEGSSGSRVTKLDTVVEEVPEIDVRDFVYMEDMEQLLTRTCCQLCVGPPMFLRHDNITVNTKNFFSFTVVVPGGCGETTLVAKGRMSVDDKRAREDAAFVALDQLLTERQLKIFDYNYHAVLRYQRQVQELHGVAHLSSPEKVLSELVGIYTELFDEIGI